MVLHCYKLLCHYILHYPESNIIHNKRVKSNALHSGGKVCIRANVAHQAGAYPGFRSMKRLGVFLLPPGWDASPSQGYPPALSSPVERGTVSVKCLAQEHNTMSPARARTRTARSGVERTNHETTVPPSIQETKRIL